MSGWRAYDDLKIGDTFPEQPARFAVTRDVALGFRRLTAASRIGDGIVPGDLDTVPPMLAAVYIRPAQNALKGPPGGIHAKQRFQFVKQIHFGDELETVLTIKEKYEKKGRRYLVSETLTRNQKGEEVTRSEIISIWGQEK